jgi:alpha-L-fucosidase
MTISAHNQWSWGGSDDGVKSFKSCLEMLVGCAGGNGNMLMNVGPTPLGKIAREQVDRLKELGTWLEKYGQSIYGTRGGPFKPDYYGTSTHKGKSIYLHLRDCGAETIELPAIDAKIKSAKLLAGGKVKYSQSSDGISITIPEKDRQPIVTVVELEIDSDASEIAPVSIEKISVSTGKKAKASNIYMSQEQFGPDKATDGDDATRWAADNGVKSAWLEVDLEKEETFSKALINEAYPERVQKYQLQKKVGDEWVTFYEGTTIGDKKVVAFDEVKARCVRLNVLESTDGPTIFEFQVLK